MKITMKFMRLDDLKPGAIIEHAKSNCPAVIIEREHWMAKGGIPAQSLDAEGDPMGVPFIIYATDITRIVRDAQQRRGQEGRDG